eukprot:TRINITY_DN693_c0_g1_i1.p1 TRINITY_DN693_c0_g1~~TRINITY_DN693_c0_g1_i1.p1  ORF type:complete len:291 (+),score=63.16 TRINITY_DN693_c0_g1_i1:559-1431(+)
MTRRNLIRQKKRQQSVGSSNFLNTITVPDDAMSEYSDYTDVSLADTGITEDDDAVGDATDVPKPQYFFSFDNEKTGMLGMVHMGVPFPRVKDFSLYYGDHWKSYLMTQKKFRLSQKGWTLSIFFKCSKSHLLDLHEPLSILSKGPLKKSTSIWIQRSKKTQEVYLYTCVNCVYDNQILKLPLRTDFREAQSWHHVAVRVKGRKAVLLLDEQQPVKGNLVSRNSRNRFQTTGQALFVGCCQTAERRGEATNFFHGQLYNLAAWDEPLSLLQKRKSTELRGRSSETAKAHRG